MGFGEVSCSCSPRRGKSDTVLIGAQGFLEYDGIGACPRLPTRHEGVIESGRHDVGQDFVWPSGRSPLLLLENILYPQKEIPRVGTPVACKVRRLQPYLLARQQE